MIEQHRISQPAKHRLGSFITHQHALTRDIDIAILSVHSSIRDVLVPYQMKMA